MRSNIEAERARFGLTRTKLSEMLGISSTSYTNYVYCKTPIPSDKLLYMAKLFNCSIDYLIDESGTETHVHKTWKTE